LKLETDTNDDFEKIVFTARCIGTGCDLLNVVRMQRLSTPDIESLALTDETEAH
jgi:hypothetical protein